jgi:hypothetical protein
MDNIAFLGLKSCSGKKGQNYNNSPSSKRKIEECTVEYNADRMFFEMLEFNDDAQDWEDYQHKGHIKNEAEN